MDDETSGSIADAPPVELPPMPELRRQRRGRKRRRSRWERVAIEAERALRALASAIYIPPATPGPSPQTARQDEEAKAKICKEAQLALVAAANRTAMPLHALQHDAWREATAKIAYAGSCGAWLLPSCSEMRGPLLEDDYERVKVQAQRRLSRLRPGLPAAIVCDGWKNEATGKKMLNIMIVSIAGECFHSAIMLDEGRETAEYIRERLATVIDEFGPGSILSVIVDNASNWRLAGKLLERQYPRFFSNHCQSHAFNMVAANWGKLPWLKHIVSNVRKMVLHICNQSIPLDLFRRVRTIPHNLRKPSTRFASNYLVMERFVEMWKSVETAMELEEMKAFEVTQGPEIVLVGDTFRALLADISFYSRCALLMDVLSHIWFAIRRFDSSSPRIGKVYLEWEKLEHSMMMRQDIGDCVFTQEERQELLNVVQVQRQKAYSDLVGAANILDPQFHFCDLESRPEIMSSLQRVAAKFFPVKEHYDSFFRQFFRYWKCQGLWSREEQIADLEKHKKCLTTEEPWLFWQRQIYPSCMRLQEVGMAVLSQVASNSSCERNGSNYEAVHSLKRNQLVAEKSRKLVYVYTNSRSWGGRKVEGLDVVSRYSPDLMRKMEAAGATTDEESSDGMLSPSRLQRPVEAGSAEEDDDDVDDVDDGEDVEVEAEDLGGRI